MENLHTPVLMAETLRHLDIKNRGVYIDATIGLGGHSDSILSIGNAVRVVGIDRDREAIKFTRRRLGKYKHRIAVFHSNFSEISSVLRDFGVENVDGVVADLGVSSIQFDSETRGFSFRYDAPLDMRMDTDSQTETAAELLGKLSEKEIANLIYEYGEERFSRRIARRIVEKRNQGEAIQTTKELVEVIEKSVPRKPKDKIHPATKTFQALRIAVNMELEILDQFIRDGVELLKTKGRLIVITFHSLEDRIVKRTMQNLAGKCFCPPKFPRCVCGMSKKVKILTRKPLTPSDLERTQNPRSRSAKMRVCVKLK